MCQHELGAGPPHGGGGVLHLLFIWGKYLEDILLIRISEKNAQGRDPIRSKRSFAKLGSRKNVLYLPPPHHSCWDQFCELAAPKEHSVNV